MTTFVNPHFDFPFRRGADGKVVCNEQGTQAQITAQQMRVLVTPMGYRDDRPDFGWPWPEFTNIPIDLSGLRDAFVRLVPDADVRIEEWADAADAAIRHIHVDQLASGEGVAFSYEGTSGSGGSFTPTGEGG